MRCPVCGEEVEKDWEFCSRCGAKIARRLPRFFDFGLEDVFKSFSKEMERLEKMQRETEKDFSVIDLRQLPLFKPAKLKPGKPGARGFTIKISTRTGEKPKINIRTFGDVEKGQIEQQVARQLGVKPEEVKALEIKPAEAKPAEIPVAAKPAAKPVKPKTTLPKLIPKKPLVTEEPKAKVTQLPGKVVVELELPGVKKEEDIEVRQMGESAEVKALAKDRVYFKILTLPPDLGLVAKEFKDEKLRLEFGY